MNPVGSSTLGNYSRSGSLVAELTVADGWNHVLLSLGGSRIQEEEPESS